MLRAGWKKKNVESELKANKKQSCDQKLIHQFINSWVTAAAAAWELLAANYNNNNNHDNNDDNKANNKSLLINSSIAAWELLPANNTQRQRALFSLSSEGSNITNKTKWAKPYLSNFVNQNPGLGSCIVVLILADRKLVRVDMKSSWQLESRRMKLWPVNL